MHSIESLRRIILDKFDIMRQIAKKIPDANTVLKSIEETQTKYELQSISIIASYYEASTKQYKNDKDRDSALTPYQKKYVLFIKSFNLVNQLKNLGDSLRKIISATPGKKSVVYDREIKTQIVDMKLFPLETTPKAICVSCSSEIFPSNINMYETSCLKCGALNKLENPSAKQELYPEIRIKCGNYDPNRHCRMWIDRIQAKETQEIPQELIDKLKHMLERDSKVLNPTYVTCALIRRYFRKTGFARYNEHIPLIRAKLTGKMPPELTDQELRKISNYFDEAIRIYNMKSAEFRKSNCPYHPYFIYKIIEAIIPDSDHRKKGILSCIHLQSRDTLIENDNIWRIICNQLNKEREEYIKNFFGDTYGFDDADTDQIDSRFIKYRPTDRFRYQEDD
jgi:hypothetical protein